jgi:hypothetical protein
MADVMGVPRPKPEAAAAPRLSFNDASMRLDGDQMTWVRENSSQPVPALTFKVATEKAALMRQYDKPIDNDKLAREAQSLVAQALAVKHGAVPVPVSASLLASRGSFRPRYADGTPVTAGIAFSSPGRSAWQPVE